MAEGEYTISESGKSQPSGGQTWVGVGLGGNGVGVEGGGVMESKEAGVSVAEGKGVNALVGVRVTGFSGVVLQAVSKNTNAKTIPIPNPLNSRLITLDSQLTTLDSRFSTLSVFSHSPA
jgi:hypothetical protein